MSVKPETVENVEDDRNWDSDYSIDSDCPVPVSKKLKREAVEHQRRSTSKHYEQKFRASWMQHELLRSWIEPVDGSEYMAHCKVCDCVLKAKFSSLKTHNKSDQHTAAVKNCPKYMLDWKPNETAEGEVDCEADMMETPKPLIITKNISNILQESSEMRRQKVWTSNNVKRMIYEYTLLKNDFRDPKQKQKLVWERLAANLQNQGINVTAEDADKKWRNLKMTFKRIFYEEGRSDQSKSQWEFYDSLLGLFSLDDNETPVRKSRTISPPRDEVKAYVVDVNESNQIEMVTPKSKVRTVAAKPKMVPVEEYVEDINNYQVEELQTLENESLMVEDRKPQIVQSFDIDFLDNRPGYSAPSVVEVHRMKNEAVRRNPLSPAHEQVMYSQLQPPTWFKNFQKRYDSDTKLILTKLNNIREVQNTQQNCLNILEHKVDVLEERLARVIGSEHIEESEDEAGQEVAVEEASMEEYYIEENN